MPRPYKFDDPTLPALVRTAAEQYDALVNTLAAIQQRTGINGFHADPDGEADEWGVLEIIQALHDDGEFNYSDPTLFDAFKTTAEARD